MSGHQAASPCHQATAHITMGDAAAAGAPKLSPPLWPTPPPADLISALCQLGPDVLRASLWLRLGPSSRTALRQSCTQLRDLVCVTSLSVPMDTRLTVYDTDFDLHHGGHGADGGVTGVDAAAHALLVLLPRMLCLRSLTLWRASARTLQLTVARLPAALALVHVGGGCLTTLSVTCCHHDWLSEHLVEPLLSLGSLQHLSLSSTADYRWQEAHSAAERALAGARALVAAAATCGAPPLPRLVSLELTCLLPSDALPLLAEFVGAAAPRLESLTLCGLVGSSGPIDPAPLSPLLSRLTHLALNCGTLQPLPRTAVLSTDSVAALPCEPNHRLTHVALRLPAVPGAAPARALAGCPLLACVSHLRLGGPLPLSMLQQLLAPLPALSDLWVEQLPRDVDLVDRMTTLTQLTHVTLGTGSDADARIDSSVVLAVFLQMLPPACGVTLRGCVATGDFPDALASRELQELANAVALRDGPMQCEFSYGRHRAHTMRFHGLCLAVANWRGRRAPAPVSEAAPARGALGPPRHAHAPPDGAAPFTLASLSALAGRLDGLVIHQDPSTRTWILHREERVRPVEMLAGGALSTLRSRLTSLCLSGGPVSAACVDALCDDRAFPCLVRVVLVRAAWEDERSALLDALARLCCAVSAVACRGGRSVRPCWSDEHAGPEQQAGVVVAGMLAHAEEAAPPGAWRSRRPEVLPHCQASSSHAGLHHLSHGAHGTAAHGAAKQQLPLRASPSSSAFLRSVLSKRAAPLQRRGDKMSLHATDFSMVGSLALDVQAATLRAADTAGEWAAQAALCVSSPVLALMAMLQAAWQRLAAVLVEALQPHAAAGAPPATTAAAASTAEHASAPATTAAALHTSSAASMAPSAEAAAAPDAPAAAAAVAASPWWAQARERASGVSASGEPHGATPAGFSSSGSSSGITLARIALPVALAALAVVAVAFARRVGAERAREKRLRAVLEMNGMSLGRQKQRFLNAIERPDDTTDEEDERAYDAGEEQELRPLPMPGRGERAMAASWESFVHGSKMDSVNDVWNKAKANGEAPRVSKKRLEEMSARVRAAQPTPSSKEFVSFDKMCQEEDFDAGMAARVAQRKARFQGQFLSNEDVGLKTPKGSSSSTSGSAKAGAGKSQAAAGAGAGAGAPLPRGQQLTPQQHPPMMRPASPPPPLRLNASTEDIADSEFRQSLRMRSQLDYIHPAALGPLAKSELKRAGIAASKAAAAAAAAGGGQQQQQRAASFTDDVHGDGNEAALLRGAARARMANEHRRARAAGGGGYDDEDEDELPPPVVPLSSVSVGLLRGSALTRLPSEQRRAARDGMSGGVGAGGAAAQQHGRETGGVTAAPDAQQQQL
ncbi:hypothetical protein FOA52_006157 [Chlamydomonas sp. UWO 241]|nr:hypothetical protein FOA52_006157 [Chlamydomonas sp. UWO 241]